MNGLRLLLADADPAGLPAPVMLLKFLLVFTFVLHVLFMNVALGGSLVYVWAQRKARRSEKARTPDSGAEAFEYHAVARTMGRALPIVIAFTITTGVAPLLFTQLLYGQLFYTSSILMAWFWLAIVALLLVAYYASYGVSILLARPGLTPVARRRAVLFGVAGSVLILAIGFLFTNNMTLMLRPEQHAPMYFSSASGLHTDIADLWVWPRFLHMVVGALAVTGLFMACAARLGRTPGHLERRGISLFRAATLAQCVVGAALLVSLPQPLQEIIVSGRTPEPLIIAAGVGFALAAAAIARRSLFIASAAAVVAIADMAIVRHRVRDLLLEPYFRTDSLSVTPQIGAFVLFAVLLVAGLAVVGWMVWKIAKSSPVEVGGGGELQRHQVSV